jgi:lactate permease
VTVAAIFAALPVIVVLALIASRRVSVLVAGFVGWFLAAIEALSELFPLRLDLSAVAIESLRGSWIAWQSATVVTGGLFFYLAVRRRESLLASTAPPRAFSHRQLWSICFLLGPVVESATGFGVGAVIAFPAILQMGVSGTPAITLALYSQMLVPWGALAVGTIIGSALANIAPTVLAFAIAILTAPLLAGYLVLYWHFAGSAGHRVPLRQKIDDVAWTLLLMLSIVVATGFVAVELGAIVSGGTLLVFRWWRDERPSLRRAAETAIYITPYATLIVALILTRSLPPAWDVLQNTLMFAPFPDLPNYPVLYNPSFWLVAVAISVFFALRLTKEIPSAIAETARRAWRPIALTVVFLAMAQVLSSAGAAVAIGAALKATLGNAAQIVAPLVGGLGGFLIGSNSASTGMMMPIQTALGIDNALWPAALQTTSASNFTLLSPPRVGMTVALARFSGGEAAVYRQAWPIGAMLVVLLTIEATIIALLG